MMPEISCPPESTSAALEGLTPCQRIALWMEVCDAGEALLLAGLRREVGPAGDVAAAYRNWSLEQRKDHDQMLRRIAQRLSDLGVGNGR